MQRTKWAALLMILGTAATAGQTAADGEIAGRITDIQAAAVPGVRITINGNDERHEVVTDSDGRFVLRSLKLGQYRVVADIAGFISESGNIVLSPTTRRAYIAWPLEVGCLVEYQRVVLTAREAAPMMDAIVHVRVTSDNGLVLWSVRPECDGTVMQDYTVQLLNAVPGRTGTGYGQSSLQMLMLPREARLEPGREYLALLWTGWRAESGLVFPILSGRVASPAGDGLSGLRVDEALKALGRWSRERQQ